MVRVEFFSPRYLLRKDRRNQSHGYKNTVTRHPTRRDGCAQRCTRTEIEHFLASETWTEVEILTRRRIGHKFGGREWIIKAKKPKGQESRNFWRYHDDEVHIILFLKTSTGNPDKEKVKEFGDLRKDGMALFPTFKFFL